MTNKHGHGKGKEEEKAQTVLDQHVREQIYVGGVEPVGGQHVGSAAEKVEEGDEAKEGGGGGGGGGD